MLSSRSLPVSGNKAVLIDRLRKYEDEKKEESDPEELFPFKSKSPVSELKQDKKNILDEMEDLSLHRIEPNNTGKSERNTSAPLQESESNVEVCKENH